MDSADGGMCHMCGGGWGWMGLGWFIWILIFVLLVALVIGVIVRLEGLKAGAEPSYRERLLLEEIRELRNEVRELKKGREKE